ncbi:MAG: ATP synthase F0 subunit B [Polyangiales bacterium]
MKRVRSMIFALAVAALSLPALAQEGHHAQPGGFSAPPVPFNMTSYPAPTVTDAHGNQTKGATAFIGPVINFVLLMVLGYMALRRSINPALAARRAAIETEIAEAQRMHTEAESMHQEYADKLARLDEEIARLKADFTRAGEAERDRIVAEAREKAERMRADARASIEQEVKTLRDELHREAVLAAVTAAEETVRKTITAADHGRLADDYIQSLDAEAQQGARA